MAWWLPILSGSTCRRQDSLPSRQTRLLLGWPVACRAGAPGGAIDSWTSPWRHWFLAVPHLQAVLTDGWAFLGSSSKTSTPSSRLSKFTAPTQGSSTLPSMLSCLLQAQLLCWMYTGFCVRTLDWSVNLWVICRESWNNSPRRQGLFYSFY